MNERWIHNGLLLFRLSLSVSAPTIGQRSRTRAQIEKLLMSQAFIIIKHLCSIQNRLHNVNVTCTNFNLFLNAFVVARLRF